MSVMHRGQFSGLSHGNFKIYSESGGVTSDNDKNRHLMTTDDKATLPP